MDRHRIGIVVPALNETKTVRSVVASVSQYGLPIVVDDGSTDGTGALAEAAGAMVVRHDIRRGYDEALNSGFARAAEMGCQFVVTMDADGQHDPGILRMFIQALDGGADVVIGNRDRRQRLSEYVFSWVAFAKWGIGDPLCGMKAYRMDVYRELGHFDCYGSIGTELAIFAARRGKRMVQLSLKIGRRMDEPRFGKRFSANKRILRALWFALFPR